MTSSAKIDGYFDAVNLASRTLNRLDNRVLGATRELSDEELTILFNEHAVARRIVTLIPDEALRDGVYYEVEDSSEDEESTEKIESAADSLDVLEAVHQACIWARLYGGAAIWIVCEGDQSAVLRAPARVSTLEVLDRRYLKALQTELDPRGKPVYWEIRDPSGEVIAAKVHTSRLAFLGGALTDRATLKKRGGWDHSVLFAAHREVRGQDAGWDALDNMLSDGSLGVFRMSGLYQGGATNQFQAIGTRFAALEAARSMSRSILIDKDHESYERQWGQFAGVGDLLDRLANRVALAANIPVTRLFGMAPAGLNATGDADTRAFFGVVQALREQLAKPIETIMSLATGKAVHIDWPPLWSPTAKEEAEAYALRATADSAYIDRQVFLPEEVALSRTDDRAPEIRIDRQLRVEALAAAKLAAESTTTQARPLAIAPTDLAKAVTVDEIRASQGLPPLPNGAGVVTLSEYIAAQEAATAPALGPPDAGSIPG